MSSKDVRSQVVIKRVDETEVYFNDELEIVIKQTDLYGEVAHVFFCASHAKAVIAAIKRAASQIEELAKAAEEDQDE